MHEKINYLTKTYLRLVVDEHKMNIHV